MTTPNQNEPAPTKALTVAPKREIRVVEDESPAAYMLDTAKFEHCYRLAEAMSRASLLPKHLKGANQDEAKANCFLVVNQAMAWKLNPFLIMGETYEVQGKLGFQGKLIISVMNTRAGLREKLNFEFNDKKGDDLAVTVSGRFIGEDSPRTVTVSVGQAKTSNSMWIKDPEQKLIYTGAIRWARRHAPEIVMGVMIEEDLEAMREEAHIASLKQVKQPVFEGPQPPALPEPEPEKPKRPRKTLVEEPLDTPSPDPIPKGEPTAAPSPSQVPVTVPPPQIEAPAEKELRELNETLTKLCDGVGISQDQLILYMRAEKWLKPHHKKPTDLSSMMLKAFVKGWQGAPDEMVKRIKGAK